MLFTVKYWREHWRLLKDGSISMKKTQHTACRQKLEHLKKNHSNPSSWGSLGMELTLWVAKLHLGNLEFSEFKKRVKRVNMSANLMINWEKSQHWGHYGIEKTRFSTYSVFWSHCWLPFQNTLLKRNKYKSADDLIILLQSALNNHPFLSIHKILL